MFPLGLQLLAESLMGVEVCFVWKTSDLEKLPSIVHLMRINIHTFTELTFTYINVLDLIVE